MYSSAAHLLHIWIVKGPLLILSTPVQSAHSVYTRSEYSLNLLPLSMSMKHKDSGLRQYHITVGQHR